mmetsp:Transcript_27334/g.50100  ORF Transcript_27334/g.50100 Transcript_27334/m.50100 type:complete len:288 (-) Transcript_27334:2753-3616(-)
MNERGDTDDGQQVEHVGANHVAERNIRLTAQRRHHGGRQFGQRGTQRDQRQSDHCVAHAIAAGNDFSVVHHQVRAQWQANKPQKKEDNNPPPRHVRVCALNFFLVHFHGRFGLLVAPRLIERATQHQSQSAQKNNTVAKTEETVRSQSDEEDRSRNHHDEIALRITVAGVDRRQNGRNTQHKKNVGNVGADNVTNRYAWRVLERGLDGNQQFRRGGAKGHNRQRDNQRRNPDPQRQVHGATYQRVPSQKQDHQTQRYQQPFHTLPHVLAAGAWPLANFVAPALRAFP